MRRLMTFFTVFQIVSGEQNCAGSRDAGLWNRDGVQAAPCVADM